MIKFIYEWYNAHNEKIVDKRLTYETREETMHEIIEDFKDFLKGCGFSGVEEYFEDE